MTMRVKYVCRPGAFKEAFTAPYALMAQAAQQAVAQAGEEVKTAARASIASAGLGPGFVKALRVDIYPRRRNSLNASAHIYHRIPYAGVFEEGATIRGKPRLWIPLRSAPQKIGKKRMTPQEYVARVGPLQFVQLPGRNPLLFARMKGKRAGGKVTLGIRCDQIGTYLRRRRRRDDPEAARHRVHRRAGHQPARAVLRAGIQVGIDRLPQLYASLLPGGG